MKAYTKVVLFVVVSLLVSTRILAQNPGDIIITEFMANPEAVGDSDGEYIELYNNTTSAINLNSDTLMDDGSNSHIIDNGGQLLIQPHSFLVLAKTIDPWNNGVIPDYVFGSSFTLGNSDDEIILKTPSGIELARCNYNDGDAAGAGVALELNDISLGTDGLTEQDDYVASSTQMSNGDYGSPGSAGNTQGVVQHTQVSFTSAAATVNEGDGSYDITVSIDNPDAANPTSVEVAMISGDDTDIGGFTPQTLTFPAGSTADQTIPINILDDAVSENNETLTFELQNVSGGDNATIGSPNQFDLVIQDNDLPDLVINEINADPGEDANGDGNISSDDDEFVEIVNNTNSRVDISGYTISDAGGVQFTFSSNTILPPNSSIVVFGGGNPTGSFGSSLIQTTGSLSLNNGGDDVVLKNPSGVIVDSYTYGSEGADNQSLTRNPDITGTFTKHSEIPAANGALQSPGTKLNGTPFDGAPDFGATRTAKSDTTLDYPAGVAAQIFLSGVSGSGPITVQLFNNSPENVSGIPENYVSTFRWVISNPSGVTFDSQTEVRFLLNELPNNGGVLDGNNVTIYKRETPGSGAFAAVSTNYDANSNALIASNLSSFSEFVLASQDQSLPVTLSSFTGEVTTKGIALHWVTESEYQNQGFILERSPHKDNGYQVITTYKTNPDLKGAGSTPARTKYDYSDSQVKIGETYWYRLSDVAFDGTVTEHEDRILKITVEPPSPEENFQYNLKPAYPNPFNASTEISYTIAKKEHVTIELYDLNGRSVMTLSNEIQTPGAHKIYLSIPDLSSGVYFIHLQTPNYQKSQQIVLLK